MGTFPINPCYHCTQRSETCHSTCQAYSQFVERNEHRKDTVRKNRAKYYNIQLISGKVR